MSAGNLLRCFVFPASLRVLPRGSWTGFRSRPTSAGRFLFILSTTRLHLYPKWDTLENMNTSAVKTTFIRARVDPRLKREAETVFRTLGVNTTSAVTMFLKQVSLRKGIPFDICVPNEETVRAFNEKLVPRSAYVDADKLMRDILTDA